MGNNPWVGECFPRFVSIDNDVGLSRGSENFPLQIGKLTVQLVHRTFDRMVGNVLTLRHGQFSRGPYQWLRSGNSSLAGY